MNKVSPDNEIDRDTMKAEYTREELGKGVRGKYFKRYWAGTNVALLESDVRKAFPTDEAVNEALRSVMTAKGLAH
jgi:hypothetical protein